MPWMLFWALIFGVIAAGLWGLRCLAKNDDNLDDKDRMIWVTGFTFGVVFLGFFGVVFLAWSFIGSVSTRNVGIITEFGKPVATRANGLTVKLPWQHISELSGVIQTDNQVGGIDAQGKCTGSAPVRLANNSTACADVTVRWRIKEAAGDQLFRDYKDLANIKDSLITRDLNQKLNEVFAGYNPISPDAASGPNLADLSTKTTQLLKDQVGTQIDIQNVIIQLVHFDPRTQDQINAYQVALSQKNVAVANQQSAAAQAEANRLLASSVDNSPLVLASHCLDVVAHAAPGQLPAYFPCFPGAGAGVVVGTGR